MFNFFCFDAWILISNEESDENNVWFGYDIQNTCGFHLGFHWVSKLMHVTNLAIFEWLLIVWIINEFENYSSCMSPWCVNALFIIQVKINARWENFVFIGEYPFLGTEFMSTQIVFLSEWSTFSFGDSMSSIF